jgi:hypothetical protein
MALHRRLRELGGTLETGAALGAFFGPGRFSVALFCNY